MSKKTNPFASKKVQILGKDYSSKSPVKWKGSFVAIADSVTRLSNKSDVLTFSVGPASPGDTPSDSKGLLLAGESEPVVQYSTLDMGKGNDRLVAKANGATPVGTTGGFVYLRYNGTTINLGDGNDSIEADIIRLRDGRIFGGNGNDKIVVRQDLEVEQWETKLNPATGLVDLGNGDDIVHAGVVQVAGKILMGEGKDTITGLIDNHWTQFNRNPRNTPLVDMGAGDDKINLRYASSTLNAGDEGMGVFQNATTTDVTFVEINGGDGFDRISITGGTYENIDINGIGLMKYSANGFDFYYKLTSIEEVSYA